MTSATPWSIKGIDPKTREKVKKQAREAGMTMGEWLSQTVENAENSTISLVDNDDVLAENVEKLKTHKQFEQVDELRATGTEGLLYSVANEQKNRQTSTNSNAFKNVNTMSRSRNYAQMKQTKGRSSAVIRGANARSDTQMSNGFNVIESALSDIVDHIELADKNNSSALRNMQAQIAHLNNRAKAQTSPVATSIQKEFGNMEDKLSSLAERIDELNKNSAAIVHSVQDQQQLWTEEQTQREQFEQNDMLTRFDELFIKLDNLNHHQRDYSENVKFLEEDMQSQLNSISGSLTEQLTAGTENYDEGINQMDARLSELSERLEGSIDSPKVDPQIEILEDQINQLTNQLTSYIDNQEEVERMQAEQELVEPDVEELSPEIIALQENMQAVNERLEQNISDINIRLEKTEERLEGIDRIENNMAKLIESVSEVRESSHDVANEAAMGAIKAFSKSQEETEKNNKDEVGDLISQQMKEISKRNSDVEREHLSGFKTVQTSLETIMDRLTKVEATNVSYQADAVAPPMSPPDRYNPLMEQQRADASFIQPGAEMNAEQPQDITAKNNSQAIATETRDTTPKNNSLPLNLDMQEPKVRLEQMVTMAPEAVQKNIIETHQESMPQPNKRPNPMSSNTISVLDITSETKVVQQSTNLEADLTEMNIQEMNIQPEQLNVAPVNVDIQEQIAPTGLENNEERPVAQANSSLDFIAAARQAAKDAYDQEVDSSASKNKKPSISLFKKIKKAAEKNKHESIGKEKPAQKKQKKKFSLANFKLGKGVIEQPDMQDLNNNFGENLPEDLFEEKFYNESSMPAENAKLAENGNELNAGKRKSTLFKKSRKRNMAPFIVGGLIIVIALVAVRFLANNDSKAPVQNSNIITDEPTINNVAISENAIKPISNRVNSTANSTVNTTNVANPTGYVIPTYNGTQTGFNTPNTNTSNNGFTPNEFTQLPNIKTGTHQPTKQQLEALKSLKPLVTNSITKGKTKNKAFTKSLLAKTTEPQERTANLTQTGSSSLTKSKSAIKKTLPTVKAASGIYFGELPEAIGPELLRKNAIIGKAAEQFEIANRYAYGVGVPADMEKSFSWIVKAADNKLAVAQSTAGMMLENGKGTIVDMDQAKVYYQLAADQGNLNAIYRIAMINAAPRNPTKDPDFKTALKWFNIAADAGLVDAQFNLAVLYEKGHGTKTDLVETYKWYTIAGKKGDKQAAKRATLIKTDLTPSQILTANAKVKSWKISKLPIAANVAPKLAYLTNEIKQTKVSLVETKHVKKGAISTDLKANKKSIKSSQVMLKILGWNVGAVDGIMGSKTRKAIKEFQSRHNLIVTGVVNDELLANLEDATL